MSTDRPPHLDPDTTVAMPAVIPEPRGSGEEPASVDADGRFTPNPWRRRAAGRLTLAGRRHARHWTDLAGTGRRPGPHAVIFLYREPARRSNDPCSGTVAIATRMFLHGDDVIDLHTILTELHARAVEYAEAEVRHRIAQLADTAEAMTSAARYFGLGTSTIDGDRRFEPGDWPWQGLAELVDGTRLILRGASTVDPPDLRSSHTLDDADRPIGTLDAFNPARAWRWTRPDLRDTDPELAAQQDALGALHALLHGTQTPPRRHRRGAGHPRPVDA